MINQLEEMKKEENFRLILIEELREQRKAFNLISKQINNLAKILAVVNNIEVKEEKKSE